MLPNGIAVSPIPSKTNFPQLPGGNAEKKNSDHRGLPLSIVKSYIRIQF